MYNDYIRDKFIMSNVLVAIKNLVNNPILSVKSHYAGRNRVNGVGDALEQYIKDFYAADKEIYERIKNTIVDGLYSINDIELAETNELGKVKKVDPLGITDLRVRGMWSIFHPKKVFDYLPKQNMNSKFKFYCIIKEEKFNAFSGEDKKNLLNLADNKHFFINSLKIRNPNNPAELTAIKFMEFYYG